MTGYIPPGSQEPFTKGRAYGQEPGFVSRHSGKIMIAVALAVVVAIVTFYIATMAGDGDDDPGQQTTQQQ